MNVVACWDNELLFDLIDKEDILSRLNNLLDTFDLAKHNNDTINYCDCIYNYDVNGISFADWLFDKTKCPELNDIKRELSIRLNKSISILSDDYNVLFQFIKQKTYDDYLMIGLKISDDNVLYVYTPDRYFEAKQDFLENQIVKNSFFDEAKECFPELFFHENVKSSLDTLNADYNIVKHHIVCHLKALNEYSILSQHRLDTGISFRDISQEISRKYGIECSPQSGRETVQNLKMKYFNKDDNTEEILCCELHTKLKWNNMDRKNQDRIYFHPGKIGIEKGKILIYHIGMHL